MRRKADTSNKHHGFTIIELLIATLVFSVLLIVMLAAFIRTGDLFYKGVSMMKTQEDGRNIVQSVADDIQFTQNAPTFPSGATSLAANINTNPSSVFCIGTHRYAYQIGAPVGQANNYGLARDNVVGGSCPAVGSGPGQQQLSQSTGEVQMLDTDMQLNALNITCTGGQIGRCTVGIHVIFYGGDPKGLFSSPTTSTNTPWLEPDAQCTGTLNDTSLCATVDYSSTVLENT